jgi:hypothetical protein
MQAGIQTLIQNDVEQQPQVSKTKRGRPRKNVKITEPDVKKTVYGKPFTNDFVDDLTIATQDILVDKKMSRPNLSHKNNRPPPKTVDVVCRRCKRDLKISKELATRNFGEDSSEYVCDKCLHGGWKKL